MEDAGVVLDLAAIADPHIEIDVYVLAEVAFLAELRAFPNLRTVPYAGARPDLCRRGDLGAGVYPNLIAHTGSIAAIPRTRPRTEPANVLCRQ